MSRAGLSASLAPLALAGAALAACGLAQAPAAPGDPVAGAELVRANACGACHRIPGVRGAHGRVGPSLAGVARQTVLAGVLPNSPENMARWVADPQSISPGNVMPTMEISHAQARDIAAYLYTLR